MSPILFGLLVVVAVASAAPGNNFISDLPATQKDVCVYDAKLKEGYQTCSSFMDEKIVTSGGTEIKQKLESAIQGCLPGLGLEAKFNEFYCKKGKYVSYPGVYFAKYLRLKEESTNNPSEKLNSLSCCALRQKGYVNQDDTLNVDQVVAAIRNKVQHQEVKNSLDVAKIECGSPTDCRLAPLLRCYLDVCAKHVASTL